MMLATVSPLVLDKVSSSNSRAQITQFSAAPTVMVVGAALRQNGGLAAALDDRPVTKGEAKLGTSRVRADSVWHHVGERGVRCGWAVPGGGWLYCGFAGCGLLGEQHGSFSDA